MQTRIKIIKLIDSCQEALLWNSLSVYVQLARTGTSKKSRTKDAQAQEHKMESRRRGKKEKKTPTPFAQTGLQ